MTQKIQHFKTMMRPLGTPMGRAHLRQFNKELEQLKEPLLRIEKEFTDAIEDPLNETVAYAEVYTNYLAIYNKEVQRLITKYKPKWLWLDPYYFARTYKPQEN